MTDKKTSDETAAVSLDGTELVRLVQTASNVKATVDQFRAFIAKIGGAVSGGTNTEVLFVDGSGDFGQSSNLTFSSPTLSIGAGAVGGNLDIRALSGTVRLTGSTNAMAGNLTLRLPDSLGADGSVMTMINDAPGSALLGFGSVMTGIGSQISSPSGSNAVLYIDGSSQLAMDIDFYYDGTDIFFYGGTFHVGNTAFSVNETTGITSAEVLNLVPVSFAGLPASPAEGMLIPITDSTTAVWGDIITGSGGNHVLGYYNGTNWTVAAK